MQQYKQMINDIFENGTPKLPARENMPCSISLFGYQTKYDLSEGFPILTTRKISFKNVVTELLWMLKGAGNIKYLVDNGCNIWNEDAYKYYVKIASKNTTIEANSIYFDNNDGTLRMFTFEEFVAKIKYFCFESFPKYGNYTLGDCPLGYEKWRKWDKVEIDFTEDGYIKETRLSRVDQIHDLIQGLLHNPQKRNHLLTAYDPTYKDVALDPCHILAQFNCRPLDEHGRNWLIPGFEGFHCNYSLADLDKMNIPKYKLDCELYQRSADSILGVPYNTSSYALLTHLLAKMCNMIPGIFIHSFGDLHIYNNHIKIWNENQASREPMKLPTLKFSEKFEHFMCLFSTGYQIDTIIDSFDNNDFSLENYQAHQVIKYPLSTGLFLK